MTIKSNGFENGIANGTRLTTQNSGYTDNSASDEIVGAVLVDTDLHSTGTRSIEFRSFTEGIPSGEFTRHDIGTPVFDTFAAAPSKTLTGPSGTLPANALVLAFVVVSDGGAAGDVTAVGHHPLPNNIPWGLTWNEIAFTANRDWSGTGNTGSIFLFSANTGPGGASTDTFDIIEDGNDNEYSGAAIAVSAYTHFSEEIPSIIQAEVDMAFSGNPLIDILDPLQPESVVEAAFLTDDATPDGTPDAGWVECVDGGFTGPSRGLYIMCSDGSTGDNTPSGTWTSSTGFAAIGVEIGMTGGAPEQGPAYWGWSVDGNDVNVDVALQTPEENTSFTLMEFIDYKGHRAARLIMTGGRILQLRDRRNNVIASSTNQVARDTWYRLVTRTFIDATSKDSNQFQVKYYANTSLGSPTETITANGLHLGPPGTKLTKARIGLVAEIKRVYSFWADNLVINDNSGGAPAAPVISSFNPTTGAEGDPVTVTGTGFTGASAFDFNGTTASFNVNSSTSISTTVPVGATTGLLHVTTPGGTDASSTDFTVTSAPGETGGWSMANLGGGGGTNSIGWTTDGATVIGWGDISNGFRSTDKGATWQGARRGTYDGGKSSVGAGIAFRNTTEGTVLTSGGWYKTTNSGQQWTRISPTPVNGSGGGAARPRAGNGNCVCNVGDYSYCISDTGTISRYRWSTSAFSNNIIAPGGVGEGIVADPDDATGNTLLAATRNGIWVINNATTSPTMTKFTGLTEAIGIRVIKDASAKYAFAPCNNSGIKRAQTTIGGAWSAGATWTNITGSNMQTASGWSCLDGGLLGGGGIRIAVGCGTARRNANNYYETVFVTDNAAAATPTWTCATINNASYMVIKKNGSGQVLEGSGGIAWKYLPKAVGGDGESNVLGTNGSAATCAVEDLTFNPADLTEFMCAAQGGNYFFDITAKEMYPAFTQLGVTANGVTVGDPNIPGLFYIMNTDHGCIFSEDGVTYRKNEMGLPTGSMAGFDICVESGVTNSRVYMAHGPRDTVSGGSPGIYFHDDPRNMANWSQIPFTSNGTCYVGIDTHRVGSSVYVIMSSKGGQFRRGIVSTAAPPVITTPAVVISGSPDIPGGPGTPGGNDGEYAPVYFLDDDTAIFFDHSNGIYLSKNIRHATAPTMWKIWNVNDESHRGTGYLVPLSADKVMVSLSAQAGANEGVHILRNLSTASGTQTVENAGIGKLSYSTRPGGGAWNNPAVIGASPVGSITRAMIVDGNESDDNGNGSADPGVWVSDNPLATTPTWTSIFDANFGQGLTKWYSGAVLPTGDMIVGMQGPGLLRWTPT